MGDVPVAPVDSFDADKYKIVPDSSLPDAHPAPIDTLPTIHDSARDVVMDTVGTDSMSDLTLVLAMDTRILDVASLVTVDVPPHLIDSFPDLNFPGDTIPDSPQVSPEPCPNGAPLNHSKPCNSCGGTIQCDGTCQPFEPQGYGTSCGPCGDKITCEGTCSTSTPPDYGTKCNPCGGTIQCDGSCSPNLLPNYGTACNCTGTIACGGSCTVTTLPDYNTDPNHCGGCGKACSSNNATPACAGGTCTSRCTHNPFEPTHADCNGDLRGDGCETKISKSPNNCGACGNICVTQQDQTGLCGTTSYRSGCDRCYTTGSGKLNCDLNPSNGCETDIYTDKNNCGGCGIICPVGSVCISPGTCINPNPPDASATD